MNEAEKGLYEDHKTNESLVLKWLEKYSKDPEVCKYLDKLKSIGDSVLSHSDQSIEHVRCPNIPSGLDEDTYILIFRKLNEMIRYEIYQIMNKYGGTSSDQEQ
jgi:hypothetical protein